MVTLTLGLMGLLIAYWRGQDVGFGVPVIISLC